jgi:hypothetical protein
MKKFRSAEEWEVIRRMVEGGLTIKEAAERSGCAYSTIQNRAMKGCWAGVGMRGIGRPRGVVGEEEVRVRREAKAREEREYEEAQAEMEREARVMVIDVKRSERLTERILGTHSSRLKVTLSELINETAEELRSGELKAKDKAVAIEALSKTAQRLYGWREERERFEEARGAVNVALITTSPAELKALGQRDGGSEGGEWEEG